MSEQHLDSQVTLSMPLAQSGLRSGSQQVVQAQESANVSSKSQNDVTA